jgi:hypothetical protein
MAHIKLIRPLEGATTEEAGGTTEHWPELPRTTVESSCSYPCDPMDGHKAGGRNDYSTNFSTVVMLARYEAASVARPVAPQGMTILSGQAPLPHLSSSVTKYSYMPHGSIIYNPATPRRRVSDLRECCRRNNPELLQNTEMRSPTSDIAMH